MQEYYGNRIRLDRRFVVPASARVPRRRTRPGSPATTRLARVWCGGRSRAARAPAPLLALALLPWKDSLRDFGAQTKRGLHRSRLDLTALPWLHAVPRCSSSRRRRTGTYHPSYKRGRRWAGSTSSRGGDVRPRSSSRSRSAASEASSSALPAAFGPGASSSAMCVQHLRSAFGKPYLEAQADHAERSRSARSR